jgi:2-amino-4-hydroxy-6-hydroxymethyldihydropteridine diphosphokinase
LKREYDQDFHQSRISLEIKSVPIFIAIGSNIEPERHIKLGLEQLQTLVGFTLLAVSSWYQTRPWGVEDQADFLNLVVAGKTTLSPHKLLTATQHIENVLGRIRWQANGPRTIDLDLLLYGDHLINEPNLVIPHPGLLTRDFMLIPLIEIAPDVIYPQFQVAVKDLTHLVEYHQIRSKVK